MTTNVFDGNSLVMATDSRWSIERGSWLFYLDDTGYSKIERSHERVLSFAGYGGKIQEWKNWIRSEPADASNIPDFKGMSVCMVDEATGIVEFQIQDIVANNAYCAGTGAYPAYGCWVENRCSKRAVVTAISKDLYSGGEVKFIDLLTKNHNLTDLYPQSQLTIADVSAAIAKRGIPMKLDNIPGSPKLPFPKAADGEAVNDEDAVRGEIQAMVAAGQISANAPCIGMHNDWTEENKEKFTQALGKMFGWKK